MEKGALNLSGVYPALVTPFTHGGAQVDYTSLARLIRFQLESGVDGVVVCGSTGEAATLSDEEYVEVVRFVRAETRGKVPCIAGISVSATARAQEMAEVIAREGCDGILLAAPPYNKPSQAGLIEHCRVVRKVSGLPIVAYNIPGRSGVGFHASTLAVLSREGTIVGIKEASGSVDFLADTMAGVDSRCQVMAGDDSLTLAVLAYGGSGVISASANVLPKEFVALVNAWERGESGEARRVQLEMLSKIRALFVESNPVPVKTVLALQGIIAEPTVRLPLVPLSSESLAKVKAEFTL